jgi:outer membrane immunogenic protein
VVPVKRAVSIGVLAIALAETPAIAADLQALPVKAMPAPAAPPSWAGAYVGIVAGETFGNSNHFVNQPAFTGPTTVDGYNVGGGLVGGTVGYNFQTGAWVYGVEGDLSFVDAAGGVNDALPVFNPTSFVTTHEHWLGTGRGRLGWATPANVLLYATGGFAVAGVEATITHPTAELTDTNTRWGWTVGAGAEAMLAPHWSAKAEYLYVNLQSASYFPQAQVPTFIPRSDVPLDQHVFRFGLDYHFAGAVPGAMAAAAMIAKAPVAAPNWAGFYLGVEAGGGFGNSNHVGGGPTFGPTTHGYRIAGALAGGTVGYNLQSGPWVYGLEGDFAWTDLRGQANEVPPFNSAAVAVTHEHWLGTGRARLGWTTPQNVLLYATGGVAAASVEAIVLRPTAPDVAQTNTRWGWTAGAGGEAMLGRGWSAKAEYLFARLQGSSYFPSPPPNIATRSDVPVDEHLVRFGVNYHFGAR